MRRSLRFACLPPLLLAPALAAAFDAVDAIPYPSLGAFPAYPQAEERPGTFFAQAGLMRDDNALRRPSGDNDETVARAGFGARYDQRVYGRQVVRLEARVDAFVYQNFSELDHVGYDLLGEWRWELGNQLAGTLGYGRRRFQTDLAEIQAPIEDIVTEDRVFGTAAYRFAPDWRIRAGADVVDRNRPAAREAETGGYGAFAGLDYVSPLGNSVGLEARYAEGDASVPELIDPLGLFVNNSYEETEVAGVLRWGPSPMLRFGARLGRTERKYTSIPGRDFEGTTGRFDVAWRPGNKTLLAFEAYRVPRSIIDIAASHVLATGMAFGPSWAPTAKLVFYARLVNEEREFSGDPAAALGVGVLRDETVRTWRFGAGWEATRRWHLGLALETGERTSNVLGRDYDYTAAMANVRFVF